MWYEIQYIAPDENQQVTVWILVTFRSMLNKQLCLTLYSCSKDLNNALTLIKHGKQYTVSNMNLI